MILAQIYSQRYGFAGEPGRARIWEKRGIEKTHTSATEAEQWTKKLPMRWFSSARPAI
jgi:hypothetical protein